MRVKTPHAGRPRVPAQRQSAQGESTPKARLRSVVDGKRFNITVPLYIAMGGRRRLGVPTVGCGGKDVGRSSRQIRKVNAETRDQAACR
jgi:hypothetical protein